MPVIHNFSDKQEKKLNIKVISILLIVAGVILITYILSHPNIQTKEIEQPTETQKKYLCISANIGEDFSTYIDKYIKEKNIDLEIGNTKECTVEIVRNPEDINEYTLAGYKLYVPVQSVKAKDKQLDSKILISGLNTQKYDREDLVWDREVDGVLRSKYKIGVGQTIYSDTQIQKKIVENGAIAIIPFEQLNPSYSIRRVDGKDILSEDFNITSYPLTDTYWYKSTVEYKERVAQAISTYIGTPNFEKDKIVNITLTGSSYIGADAYNVNILTGKSTTYMINNINSIYSDTDLLHVNNEVSIYNNCIQKISSTYLCSKEKDFEVLKKMGVKVVGVNGNHIMDFGYNSYLTTLNWYNRNGIKYFGGGINEKDAHTPRIIETKGLKVAFLGYNFIPPYSYYSSGNKGGSANVSEKMVQSDIAQAKKQADIIIVDAQWGAQIGQKIETTLIENGNMFINNGATIVNGVNSYTPLGIDIRDNSTTFYGLGGFLNPQATSGIAVKHLFYDKKYLGFTLIPFTYTKDKTLQLAEGSVKDRMISDIYKQSRIIYDEK